jgi:hypothetical protein
MNNEKKKKTLIYKNLGFPIRLINAPMRKVYGQWVFDFSMGVFQEIVLQMLATKSVQLNGPELMFIINYFEFSYRQFAKLLGVSHGAVMKWVNETSKMNIHTEVSLRLYILNHLKVSDKEFRNYYLELSRQNFHREDAGELLDLDLDQITC